MGFFGCLGFLVLVFVLVLGFIWYSLGVCLVWFGVFYFCWFRFFGLVFLGRFWGGCCFFFGLVF